MGLRRGRLNAASIAAAARPEVSRAEWSQGIGYTPSKASLRNITTLNRITGRLFHGLFCECPGIKAGKASFLMQR
jgi:hypothetical protein